MIASLTQFRPLRSDVMARRMRAKATGPFRCTACRAAEAAYSTRYAPLTGRVKRGVGK